MGGRTYELHTLPFIGRYRLLKPNTICLCIQFIHTHVLRYSRNGENFSRTVKSGCLKKALYFSAYANCYILK